MGRSGGGSITLACRVSAGIGRLGAAPGERRWVVTCKANNAAYVKRNIPISWDMPGAWSSGIGHNTYYLCGYNRVLG